MSDSAADIDRIWTLVKDIPVAMVVTHDGQGWNMRARPMAPRPAQEEGAIYFLTDVDAPKGEEIRRNNMICLALADHRSRKYLSITGRAEIFDDRDRIKRIWSVYDKAFWPDSSDPRIRILRVTPESAEFWEGEGAVVTAVKLVAATVSGERMNLGANQKVEFDALSVAPTSPPTAPVSIRPISRS
jgi:general stress protein 26